MTCSIFYAIDCSYYCTDLAISVSKLKDFTGREQPTVIT